MATLGNLLVIRALMKNSTIPATVKKLFLSLAFSDLAVGLLPQLMTAIISAVMLKMASSKDDLAFFGPTLLIVLLYFQSLLAFASFLNVNENIFFKKYLPLTFQLVWFYIHSTLNQNGLNWETGFRGKSARKLYSHILFLLFYLYINFNFLYAVNFGTAGTVTALKLAE